MKLSDLFEKYIFFFLFFFFASIGILFVINSILSRIGAGQIYSFCKEDIKIIIIAFLGSLLCAPLILWYRKKEKEKSNSK